MPIKRDEIWTYHPLHGRQRTPDSVDVVRQTLVRRLNEQDYDLARKDGEILALKVLGIVLTVIATALGIALLYTVAK